MTYPIRPISEAEWHAYTNVLSEGFGWQPPPQQLERWRKATEFDRTLAVFDGDLIVATTGIHSFTMTIPGGTLPVAGVTSVAVLASHRRRGLLTSIMLRQLADIRERGEAVAALYASEAAIYGRFGYGEAANELRVRIPKLASAFVRHAPSDPSIRLRVVKPAEVRADLERLFETVSGERPGLYARNGDFWDGVLADEEFDQQGNGPLRCVLAEDSGGVRGYALFRIKSTWGDNGAPDGELRLHELYATDPAARAALWRSVLDRDLVTTTVAAMPVDDPITQWVADSRQLNARWGDELYIRLVEVDRALASRAYSAPVNVVIEVEDQVCPWNARRWRLTADTSGAECKPVEEEPDLTVPVTALGGAYLGGGSLGGQLAAGLLREHTQGTVQSLATAMSWTPKPWAGLVF
ncbi:GNAT family N-acetyltransferase [Nonomuraea sediminis]|uniref:GNAT family N-acetyltransferase n=1 Tax=Nonomuraea sediminis TaxID=2835864 RepID=UPI001BDD6B7D|nr:GNAT family N-acetyltransferase [Nonomuraea sediminis]